MVCFRMVGAYFRQTENRVEKQIEDFREEIVEKAGSEEVGEVGLRT